MWRGGRGGGRIVGLGRPWCCLLSMYCSKMALLSNGWRLCRMDVALDLCLLLWYGTMCKAVIVV